MTNIKPTQIHQYLTFMLAGEVYAVNVASIKEVLIVPKITKVPRMPEYMAGIINLRGSAVPVLDLCKKFRLGETAMTSNTSVIVTEVQSVQDNGMSAELIIGVFSEMVQKVITIEPEQIEPPPKIGVAIDTDFIRGMGHVDSNFIIILDINKILTGKELVELQKDSTPETAEADEPAEQVEV